mmetsp:Transcript_11210/g.20520  ORF Transcript_11210/g.20520 Transcript_11210/m.20520 type:complete len:80 (-) Transcript_11210:213-452(-)
MDMAVYINDDSSRLVSGTSFAYDLFQLEPHTTRPINPPSLFVTLTLTAFVSCGLLKRSGFSLAKHGHGQLIHESMTDDG